MASAGAAGDSVHVAGRSRPFPVAVAADYQLGGAYPTGAGLVSRDWRDSPAPGAYSICAINAFQTQPEHRRRWLQEHPELVLRDRRGRPVSDPGWPGEMLLDISTAGNRGSLAGILKPWIRRCAAAGFDALEPDNLDSWTRSRGQLRPRHAVAMARIVSRLAHDNGLAVAQKNAAELLPRIERAGWDFAVVEDCQRWGECSRFTRAYSGAVLSVEYDRAHFRRSCAQRGSQISIVLRDRLLHTPGERGHVSRSCSRNR